jgi:hypothetical protein
MLDIIELTAVTCGLLLLLAVTARVRWRMFRVTVLPPHRTTFRPLNAIERIEFTETVSGPPPRQQPGLCGAPLRDQPLALGDAAAGIRSDGDVHPVAPLAGERVREGLDQQRAQPALVI